MHIPTTSSTYLKNTFSILRSFTPAITLLALFCIGFFSCQKQFTLEDGVDPNDGIQAGTAVFSVTGAPNACSVATLHGDFIAGTSVSDACTVTVTVNVTDTGSYTISTNTANGLVFTGAGKFTATGTQTIQLTANGTPMAAGTFKYTAGTKGCSFTVISLAAGSIQAEFTFSGAPNACTTDSVMGTYITGLALDASNKVKITANVTKAGAYSISTATVNGITFSSSGNLAVGTQTILLQGAGTPVATGTNSFTAGSGGCTFPVQVIAPVPAVYTLSGAPGACSLPVVNGAYQVSTPLGTTNTVTINVDVTTPGVFTIITNTVNGITFSSTGKFPIAGTGIPVTLFGSGKPVTAGVSTFTPSGSSSNCTFDVTVTAAPAGIYSCKVDGVLFSFTDRAQADLVNPLTNGPGLHLDGYTLPPNGSYIPEFQIFIDNNDNSYITPGTYDEKGILLTNGYRIEIDFNFVNPDNSVTIWNTSSNLLPPPNPPFTIVITSATSSRIKGTFSGKLTNVVEGSTGTKVITEGVFDLPVQ